MTPKQRWYCFWVIIVVTILFMAGFVWIAIHIIRINSDNAVYGSISKKNDDACKFAFP